MKRWENKQINFFAAILKPDDCKTAKGWKNARNFWPWDPFAVAFWHCDLPLRFVYLRVVLPFKMNGPFRLFNLWQSGCGAVGRVVASNTRDPRFESSQRQYYLLSTVLKRRKKKKRGQEWPYFLKKGNVPLKFYNHWSWVADLWCHSHRPMIIQSTWVVYIIFNLFVQVN